MGEAHPACFLPAGAQPQRGKAQSPCRTGAATASATAERPLGKPEVIHEAHEQRSRHLAPLSELNGVFNTWGSLCVLLQVCYEARSITPGCPIAPSGRSQFSFQVTCMDCIVAFMASLFFLRYLVFSQPCAPNAWKNNALAAPNAWKNGWTLRDASLWLLRCLRRGT